MEYLKFSIRFALSFLIAGTVILILFYFTPTTDIARVAYQFTLVAIVANWIYVLILLINLLRQKISILYLMKTLGILAINIPIGILYSYIMVWLLSYARISFNNNSGIDIAVLSIEGCEKKRITDLENGSSKTVWIKLEKECDVNIFYELEGDTKTEKVLDNIRKNEGVRISYDIK